MDRQSREQSTGQAIWKRLAAIAVLTAMVIGGSGCMESAPSPSPSASPAQETAAETAGIAIRQDGDTFEWIQNGVRVILQICTDRIVRIHHVPEGKEPGQTEVVDQRKWPAAGAKADLNVRPAKIQTAQLTVELDPEKQHLKIFDKDGRELFAEKKINLQRQEYEFTHTAKADEPLYGLSGFGAWESVMPGLTRANGGTVKGGTQGQSFAPWLWTTGGWGMLTDTLHARYTNNTNDLRITGVPNETFQYFVVVGGPYELMSGLAEISGKPPMFPKWSMGFNNSEWGIDEKELKKHINTYRKKQFPIDNFTLDFDWKAWGEDNYGDFRWNKKNFPSGESGKLAADMLKQGVKLTGIWKPRIHVKTVHGQYATDNNLWFPKRTALPDYFSGKLTRDLDFSNPETRKWYFEQAKPAFESGLIGWWNDEADDGTVLQFMMMQKTLYDGQRSISNQRVWSMNRNFYIGSQRYAYASWSGDIGSNPRAMAEQRMKMLAAINTGQMKWSMDTGGFGSEPEAETYARWMQFSALTPIFRVHGTNGQQRQPWAFGPVAEKAVKPMMHWRYEHIPYIYSYERLAYDTGIGLVRPLVYDYPKDPNAFDTANEWMFGDFFLAAPVVDLYVTSYNLYLPAGTWYDYFRGTMYEGGQKIDYKVNEKTWADTPLFVKKGAIIPSQPYMNYVGEKPVTEITFDLFPDKQETRFNYYDDDGNTYDYEKGVYFKQQVTLRQDGNTVQFTLDTPEGTYKPETVSYKVKVHGIKAKQVTFADAVVSAVKTGKDRFGDVTEVTIPAGQAGVLKLSSE